MASQGPCTQTRAGIEALERNVLRVRQVFHQVWNEFYTNKPKVNQDLTREKSINIAETSIQGAQAAFHKQLREKYADHVGAVPKLLPLQAPAAGAGAGKIGPSVGVEYKSKGRATSTSTLPKHTDRSGPITTCPPYSFCSKTKKLIRVWHGYTMPFVPMLEDKEVVEYSATFKSELWQQQGLDPDGKLPSAI
jgi:hypothetical protein